MGSSALEKGAPPSLVRSRQRVADHVEVFTPPDVVGAAAVSARRYRTRAGRSAAAGRLTVLRERQLTTP